MSTVQGKTLSIEKTLRLPGYANGLRFPSLIAHVSVGMAASEQAEVFPRFSVYLKNLLEDSEIDLQETGEVSLESAGDFLLEWMFSICQAANTPVYEKGILVAGAGPRFVLALPVYEPVYAATIGALRWLVDSFNTFIDGRDPRVQGRNISSVVEDIKQSTSIGFNTPRFLRAAYAADIPTAVIAGPVIQYGQGARARWMDSSFTDECPVLAATLSRNKDMTSRVLRSAGLPVATNSRCGSVEQAIRIANSLGYPVVIKPSDKDGGKAVAAGLMNDDEVRAAYAVASRHTDKILVEKHIPGRDYRLNVFNDELLWAIERVPAGVTGDGQSTISRLIEEENADPRRSTRKDSPLKTLVLDEEALAVLESRGFDPNGIPGEGEFVPLRRNANISTGGTPVAVLDKVHPDNRQLAIRAAAALRLDLAGIDLICDDISISWKESRAAICEVNGQPQLGGVTCPHVYGQILESMIQGNGRIPIALVVGAAPGSQLLRDIASNLGAANLCVGTADRSGVAVANEPVVDIEVDFFTAGQMLMRDRAVEAAIVNLNDCSVLKTGLPFDRFDILVLAGSEIAFPRGLSPQQQSAMLQSLLKMVLSTCSGKVFSSSKAQENLGDMSLATSAEWISADHNQRRLAEQIATEFIARS